MPAWGDIVNSLLMNKQELALREQQIQARALGLYQQKQQMDLDNQYREELRKGALLNPSVNNPNTTSVGSAEDSRDPEEKSLRDLQKRREQAQFNIDLANKFGNDKALQIWSTAANTIDTNIREAAKEVYKSREDKATQIANMARDVNSPEAVAQLVRSVKDKFGPGAAFSLDRTLPHAQDGSYLWNEPAKKVIGNNVAQYTSMADAEHKRHDAATEASAEQLRQIERDRATEDKRWHNAEIALRQQGLKQTQQRIDQMLQVSGVNAKVTKEDINRLDKITKDYKIREYQKGFEVADRVERALTDPKLGYAAVTEPQARTLADQFKLMIDNYRSRTGGKYQEQELSRMNGLLQKLDKFAETIGEGDKVLAKDVMLSTAREMKTLFDDRNVDLIREELDIARSNKLRGGNPMVLPYRGDIDRAVESGKAKKVTVNGKDYVAFGAKPSDIFELPSAPELRIIPIPVGGQ